MEEKIISTKDYLLVYPLMALTFVVVMFVIVIGSPYWAWVVCKEG